MAVCPFAEHRLIPPPSNDPPITPRVAILHVDAGNASGESLWRYFSTGSGGIESHFHIELDGTIFQFRDTAWQADANVEANDFAVSIETQGREAGEWTDAQLASIKRLLLWLHLVHPAIVLEVCPRWDGAGVGYHTLFPDRWDKRGASCPGPDRKVQFREVIVPWLEAGASEEDEMPTAREVALEILGYKNPKVNGDKDVYQLLTDGSLFRDQIQAPGRPTTGNTHWLAASYLYETFASVSRVYALLQQVAEKSGVEVDEEAIAAGVAAALGPALTELVAAAVQKGGTPEQIAQAVADELGRRFAGQPAV